MKNLIFFGLLLFTVYALGLVSLAEAAEPKVTATDSLLVELEHDGIENYRFELFSSDGSRVYDSGLVSGTVTLDLDPAVRSKVADLRFEIRAWDETGELVFSQISALGNSEIFSINFEVVPGDTTLLGTAITLDGDVDVSGGLDVTGAISTSQLVDGFGGNFFGTCPTGQLAQAINSDGSLVCMTDQTGGDNLGDHVATTTLDMGSHRILLNGSTDVHFASTDNARFGTGSGGKTFFMQGADSASDAAFFQRHDGLITLRISNEGRFKFINGQKICTAHDTSPHNTILVGDLWTSSTCSSFAVAMGAASYRLGCLTEAGVFLGSVGGGLPSPNCGW